MKSGEKGQRRKGEKKRLRGKDGEGEKGRKRGKETNRGG